MCQAQKRYNRIYLLTKIKRRTEKGTKIHLLQSPLFSLQILLKNEKNESKLNHYLKKDLLYQCCATLKIDI